MVGVVTADDPAKDLEHRLELDRTVHDGEGTFAEGGAEPSDGRSLGRLSSPDHDGGRRLVQTTQQLEDPLPGGFPDGLVERDPEVDHGDVDRIRLQELGGLVGGPHPETVDPQRLEQTRELLGEVLPLPPAVAEHEPKTLRGGFGT